MLLISCCLFRVDCSLKTGALGNALDIGLNVGHIVRDAAHAITHKASVSQHNVRS